MFIGRLTGMLVLLATLSGCVEHPARVEPAPNDRDARVTFLLERINSLEQRTADLSHAVDSLVRAEGQRPADREPDVLQRLEALRADLARNAAATARERGELRALIARFIVEQKAYQPELTEHAAQLREQEQRLREHEEHLSTLDARIAALEQRGLRTCPEHHPDHNMEDSSAANHFYEVAFVGLGALEAICFGVLGFLFTIYAQFMGALVLPENPRPPPATGLLVWISRGMTAIIILSAIAAIAPLWLLEGPNTVLALLLRWTITAVLAGLAISAFAMAGTMKVPKRA